MLVVERLDFDPRVAGWLLASFGVGAVVGNVTAAALTAMIVLNVVLQPVAVFGAGPVLDAYGTEPVLVAFAAVQTVAMAALTLSALRERTLLAGEPMAGARSA